MKEKNVLIFTNTLERWEIAVLETKVGALERERIISLILNSIYNLGNKESSSVHSFQSHGNFCCSLSKSNF